MITGKICIWTINQVMGPVIVKCLMCTSAVVVTQKRVVHSHIDGAIVTQLEQHAKMFITYLQISMPFKIFRYFIHRYVNIYGESTCVHVANVQIQSFQMKHIVCSLCYFLPSCKITQFEHPQTIISVTHIEEIEG